MTASSAPTGPVVAIDGPAGSGKSTLARALALELDLAYVNTGLMYRALTREALARGVSPTDGPGLAALAGGLRFDLSAGRPPALTVDGRLTGAELLTADVEACVSAVSGHPEVRARMVAEQRRLGEGGAVVEGRDIGTVVFPDAEVKVFLVAAPSERSARRVEERRAGGSIGPGEKGLAEALAARDARDALVNPFVPAPNALPIDTSGRTPQEVLEEALGLVRARLGGRG